MQFFFNILKEVNIYEISKNKKKKILLHGGGFINNGIASSLVSLLSNINYDEYEIYLISNVSLNSTLYLRDFNRVIERIPENVNIIN